MLNGEPIGYAQSYVALGSGDGWWEEETDPGTRNRPVTGECITTGQRLKPSWFETLVELLFNDPGGHQDPNGPVAEQLASDPMLRESGV